jgi:hypothetical protein
MTDWQKSPELDGKWQKDIRAMLMERNEVLPNFICTRLVVENTLFERKLQIENCNYMNRNYLFNPYFCVNKLEKQKCG